ncbi:tetratricopeptide repeat protein [Pacificoceanicola onchidii]|uniref:tetratricopeptide repeat protein n=1 Tax=Pacificoceanicola onchidii TaxID=2562685 RepID=UPI0010A55AAF|nr:tetratricopeptide repeat protein [Pacificoceanicola onchidii]
MSRRIASTLALILALSASPTLSEEGNRWQSAPLNEVQTAATGGDVSAQFALGLRLENGEGVLQNYASAAAWFTKAAEQGSAAAAHRLGQYYFTGIGVDQNRAAGLSWLAKAAQTGEARYLHDYGTALETGSEDPADFARAAEAYAKAAEQGFEDASVSLGVLYQNGKGVAQDLLRAKALYEGPAERGHARAQNNLGLLYVRGEGVPQDYARAVALFESAASQGLDVALRNLGVMFENGFGVDQDEARAHELYRLAAGDAQAPGAPAGLPRVVFDPRILPPDMSEEGMAKIQNGVRARDPLALFSAGWILMQLENPGFADIQQAAQLFNAAAQAGNPAAMTNLALMYFEGRVVPQDYATGYMWLVLAGTAGFDQALDLSAALASRMTPGQIAEAQKMAEARVQQ